MDVSFAQFHACYQAPSWIQTRKWLEKRRKGVLGSWCLAKREAVNGGGGGEGKTRLSEVIVGSRNAVRPRTGSVIGAVWNFKIDVCQ